MNVLVTGKKGFIGKRLKIGKKFKGRLQDYKAIFRESKNVNGIVHLASVSNKRLCEETPIKCIISNIIGLGNVLDVALKRNIWVLFISSFQVKEINLYGLSKLIGEELCRLYQAKGLKVKIIRLPIVYGPNDREDKVVTKIINELKNKTTPKILTNKKFNFLYVDDAVRMIENEVDVLNCNIGEKYSLRDLVIGIKQCLKEENEPKKK